MSNCRLLIALVLSLAWCWGAWHEDLESAGLMFEHKHHHQAHHDHGASPHQHSLPAEDEGHLPVWACNQLLHGGVVILIQLLLGAIALTGLWSLGLFRWLQVESAIAVPRWRPPVYLPSWQFVRRCAPDSAAPPALS